MNELDLIPFRTLLDHVVVPARRHVRTTLLPVAVPLAMVTLTMALVQIQWTQALTTADPEDMETVFTSSILLMAVILVGSVVMGLAFSALTVAAMDAVSGRQVRMVRAWLFVLRPTVLLTLVAVGIVDGLSIMMCFLPAFYVIPLLSFTVPAMVDEGRVGLDAMQRSIELFRFNPTGRFTHSPWVQTGLLLAVGVVFNYALNMTVQLPFAIAQQILLLRQSLSQTLTPESLSAIFWLQLPASILGALVSALAWLYSTFGICLLFRELRRRKEAGDLVEAVDQLTAAPAGSEAGA